MSKIEPCKVDEFEASCQYSIQGVPLHKRSQHQENDGGTWKTGEKEKQANCVEVEGRGGKADPELCSAEVTHMPQ